MGQFGIRKAESLIGLGVIDSGSARFGANEESGSEDSTQLLRESLKHTDVVQGVLRQYQEYNDHAGPMENETGK